MKPSHVFYCLAAAAAALVGWIFYRRGKATAPAAVASSIQSAPPGTIALPPQAAQTATAVGNVAAQVSSVAGSIASLFSGLGSSSGEELYDY